MQAERERARRRRTRGRRARCRWPLMRCSVRSTSGDSNGDGASVPESEEELRDMRHQRRTGRTCRSTLRKRQPAGSTEIEGESRSPSPSTGSEDQPPVRARPTSATAATPRASRSKRRAASRSCSTWAPACATGATRSPQDGSFRGSALITHLHWDHVQGLPFFVPDRPARRAARHLRAAAGRLHARAGVRGLHAPAVLPGAVHRPARRHPLPRRHRHRHRGRRRQGQGAQRARTSG